VAQPCLGTTAAGRRRDHCSGIIANRDAVDRNIAPSRQNRAIVEANHPRRTAPTAGSACRCCETLQTHRAIFRSILRLPARSCRKPVMADDRVEEPSLRNREAIDLPAHRHRTPQPRRVWLGLGAPKRRFSTEKEHELYCGRLRAAVGIALWHRSRRRRRQEATNGARRSPARWRVLNVRIIFWTVAEQQTVSATPVPATPVRRVETSRLANPLCRSLR
jgi:hypothetical protein